MDAERTLRLVCAACGAWALRTFALADLHVTAAGEFRPVACHHCGVAAASPAPPPWSLTATDRKFLRALRIEDDDPRTPEP